MLPATATLTLQPTRTAFPTADLSVAATQAWATVGAPAILWNGVVDQDVFRQVLDRTITKSEWFTVYRYDNQFMLQDRPALIAAYFYKAVSGGPRHGRFLMYERGGQQGEERIEPFLFKFDLPLVWIGLHDEYGIYESILASIEFEFQTPIVPNFLSMAVLTTGACQGESDPFCKQLVSQGVVLPADELSAEALIMNQIVAARKITSREWSDITRVVEVASDQGPDWWNNPNIPLFVLPRITTCIPETGCATYANMELAIDTLNGGQLP
jgi:hypothetical protein